MRVALVYDRVNKWGGAERVLLALHRLWPDAPLYTAVYDPKGALWAKSMRVIPTFLQYMPRATTHHEWYPWLTPLAFETLTFDAYDVVISVTSAEAKTILTKPATMHVCYCLTPTRYLWSAQKDYLRAPSLGGFDPLARSIFAASRQKLQYWDRIASSRPDYWLAISSRVQERIQRYYDKPVERVIYPPVDTALFMAASGKKTAQDYYLLVTRLVSYKRADLVIKAFNALGWSLVVIGTGHELRQLQRLAKPNITFRSDLTDKELVAYYQKCRAFVFAGDEDFGLVAAEAQACGKPVVCYRDSGLSEIIVDKVSGVLYNTQSVAALMHALQTCEQMSFRPEVCRENSLRFSQERFDREFYTTIEDLYNRYQRECFSTKKGTHSV